MKNLLTCLVIIVAIVLIITSFNHSSSLPTQKDMDATARTLEKTQKDINSLKADLSDPPAVNPDSRDASSWLRLQREEMVKTAH